MNKYKVIWIDDEVERDELKIFIALASTKDYNIEIVPFKRAEDGIKAFSESPRIWDGIILDIVDFTNTEGQTKGFHWAKGEILNLIEKKREVIPWFIFSGMEDVWSNPLFKDAIGGKKVYHKDTEYEQLLKDIMDEADNLPNKRFRHKYPEIFAAFDTNKFYQPLEKDFIGICQCISNESKGYRGLFNQMRNIYEMIFIKISEFMLPSGYVYGTFRKGQFNDNELSPVVKTVINYLNGEEITVGITSHKNQTETIQIAGNNVISTIIKNVNNYLYKVLSGECHYDQEQKTWTYDIETQNTLPNLFESTALLLIDFTNWAATEIMNSDKDRYKKKSFIPPEQQKIAYFSEQVEGKPDASTLRDPESGEKKIDVKLSVYDGKYLNVENVDKKGPNVFFNYRHKQVKEIVQKLKILQKDQRVKVIIKDAYEIKEFGI